MRNSMGKRVGLAGAGPRDNQKGMGFAESLTAVFDGAALFGVKLAKIVGGGH
jgi:hypothetical protein